MHRRFPPPWAAEQIPGGFKVVDATYEEHLAGATSPNRKLPYARPKPK
jgi:hypothetical protein